MDISKQFKNKVINFIDVNYESYRDLSIEQKKELLGLFMAGLPLSQQRGMVEEWIFDSALISNFCAFLSPALKRDPAILAERLYEVVCNSCEDKLIEAYDDIYFEYISERNISRCENMNNYRYG